MKKRNIMVNLRLNEEELSALNKRADSSGYSREAYIRSLLDGYVPQPMPPPDYHKMMGELRAIGNNMNQIAQKAHVLNVTDSKRYDEAYGTLKIALIDIIDAVKLPLKFERKPE